MARMFFLLCVKGSPGRIVSKAQFLTHIGREQSLFTAANSSTITIKKSVFIAQNYIIITLHHN